MQKTALESQEETRGGWKSFLAAHPSPSNLACPTTTRSRWQPQPRYLLLNAIMEQKSYHQTFFLWFQIWTSFHNSKVKAFSLNFASDFPGTTENVLCIRYIPTVQPHWVHFPRAITRAWVDLLGRLWYILVEEGLPFFLRYHGPI